ncbi:MAG: TetR/AcrR family transcriptional regulator [Myxococcales bacterium]|nr:TetR/AcrR family transcriptional regulator [Myxococcales bacterium]
MTNAARTRPAQAPQTRERILHAALERFTAKGFDGATTREIAARADANVGLLKYYFGDKLSLWRAAVDLAFEELRAGLGDLPREAAAADDRERIRLLIRRLVRYVGKHPEFVRLMHEEGKRPGERMRWLVDRHVKPFYQTTIQWVEGAQQRGLLPANIAPLHLHYILVGSIDLIFHQAAECKRLTGQDPTDDAMIEAHADAIEAIFLRAPVEDDAG